MKTILTTLGIVVAAIPLLYVASRVLSDHDEGQGAAGGPGQPPEVAVVVMQPEPVTITTELPGRTSACLMAEVRPQVSGIIQKRLFEEGANVKEDDLLYQIDPALYQAALDNAAASLAGARNSAQRARAAMDASQANVAQQQAALDLALANRRRIETLARDGVVSVSDRDKIETEARVAEAALESAEAQVISNREAVAEAETSIQQAEAALKTARINLDYTRITAPISGRIGKSNVTVGALVTAHQAPALASIQQLDPIYVDVPQSTAELLRLRRRLENAALNADRDILNKVGLILEDGLPYSREGTLQFRDVTVDPSTGSVLVRIVFPNPDAVLLPGMFVRAIVNEGVNPEALLVPQQAVSRDTKGQPVAMIVNGAGKAEQRILKLDRALGDRWLVVDGLAAGERVIVEGIQRVRAGSEVRAVAFEKNKTADAPPQGSDGPAPDRRK